MKLSRSHATAVVSIGKSVGAKILAVQAFGETKPKMSNATIADMAQNRRVEIICVSQHEIKYLHYQVLFATHSLFFDWLRKWRSRVLWLSKSR